MRDLLTRILPDWIKIWEERFNDQLTEGNVLNYSYCMMTQSTPVLFPVMVNNYQFKNLNTTGELDELSTASL